MIIAITSKAIHNILDDKLQLLNKVINQLSIILEQKYF